MNNHKTDIEQLTLDGARRQVLLCIKALELCNNSRNKLSQLQTTPDFWMNEALEKI